MGLNGNSNWDCPHKPHARRRPPPRTSAIDVDEDVRRRLSARQRRTHVYTYAGRRRALATNASRCATNQHAISRTTLNTDTHAHTHTHTHTPTRSREHGIYQARTQRAPNAYASHARGTRPPPTASHNRELVRELVPPPSPRPCLAAPSCPLVLDLRGFTRRPPGPPSRPGAPPSRMRGRTS